MLDQLIESSSGSKQGGRRGGFLLTTLVFVFALFFGGIVWSLFAKDLGIAGGDLELSNLVAPVPVADEDPPPPEEKKPEKEVKAAPNADVRKEVIQDVSESPKVPDDISVKKSEIPPRRVGVQTVQGDSNLDSNNPAPTSYRGPVSTDNKGVAGPGGKPNTGDDGDDAPPPVKKETPKPTPEAPPVPKVVSGGVVNGKAVNLVKPPYPPAARAVRAAGTVNVQVTIDENGNVISASAVSGHPLLKQAAEQAARSSKFSPTLLSGQKVKVTGVIVYNFTAQ
jgi:periplasmic protein TonB